MTDCYVGLGSNIDPEINLGWALTALERQLGPLDCSDAYRSPAFGFDGPDFLNLVVRFETEQGPDAIEAVLSALENERGRDQHDRAGSRTLDLDLLLYGRAVDAARRLPRADVLAYPFVLAPLVDLAPRLAHPVTGATLAEAWAEVSRSRPPPDNIGRLDIGA